MATRLALGGGRRHVFRQMMAESFLLAATGGAAGILVGVVAAAGLSHIAREAYGLWQPVSVDLHVMGITGALALLTSFLFGVAPAIHASTTDIRSALVEGGSRSATAGRHWPRRLLVIAEVSLGVVLLVTAGLLIRTFAHLNSVSPGYDGSGVLTASVSLDDERCADGSSVLELYRRTLLRLKEAPGVENAAAALSLPDERALNSAFKLPDSARFRDQLLVCDVTYVTPEYFRALRIRLLGGREFRDSDTEDSQPVAIVNESFVRRYLSESAPVGRRIDGKTEIVGVVADVRHSSGWGNFGPLSAAPAMYVPVTQMPGSALRLFHTWFAPSWIVRSSAPPSVITTSIREAIHAADPLLPVAAFRTLDEVRAATLRMQRVQALLLSVMAGVALLLAGIGVYGLVAQSVIERTRELGIRMALGAATSRVLFGVVGSGLALAVCGVLAGALMTRWSGKLLTSMVWGITPSDPVTYGAAIVLLLVVAAVASSVPALKVLRVDPARVLRQE